MFAMASWTEKLFLKIEIGWCHREPGRWRPSIFRFWRTRLPKVSATIQYSRGDSGQPCLTPRLSVTFL